MVRDLSLYFLKIEGLGRGYEVEEISPSSPNKPSRARGNLALAP